MVAIMENISDDLMATQDHRPMHAVDELITEIATSTIKTTEALEQAIKKARIAGMMINETEIDLLNSILEDCLSGKYDHMTTEELVDWMIRYGNDF